MLGLRFSVIICCLNLILTLLVIAVASAGRDFYKILNVPKSASTDQIKKAYRWAISLANRGGSLTCYVDHGWWNGSGRKSRKGLGLFSYSHGWESLSVIVERCSIVISWWHYRVLSSRKSLKLLPPPSPSSSSSFCTGNWQKSIIPIWIKMTLKRRLNFKTSAQLTKFSQTKRRGRLMIDTEKRGSRFGGSVACLAYQ